MVLYTGHLIDFSMKQIDGEWAIEEFVRLDMGGFQMFVFFLTGQDEGKRFHSDRFSTPIDAAQGWRERTGAKLTLGEVLGRSAT